MLAKTKKIIKSSFWQNFKDVRFLTALGFGLLAIMTAYSGVKVIGKNYVLQQEIARLDKQNQIYNMENANLKFGNQYFGTDTYLELTAREQFSKGYPGEKLIIISSAEAAAKAPQVAGKSDSKEAEDKPAYIQNLQAWRDFFFRRSR